MRGWARLPLVVLVLLLVLPLLTLMWSLLLKDLDQRQADIQREHEDRIYNVTQISAQALNSLLLAVDQSLMDLREEWAEHPESFAAVVEQRQRIAKASMGVDIHFSVIDAEGRVRFSSLNPAAVGWDASQDKHFTLPRDNATDRIFVNAPFFTPVAKRLLMPFSRRLLPAPGSTGADGFNGVIVFWVSPDFVTRIYKTTRFNQGSTFTLLELNFGQILLRHIKADKGDTAALVPAHPKNAEYINAITLSRAAQLPTTGVGRWSSMLDRTERTFAWHKFSTVPFALIVGEPTTVLDDQLKQQQERYLFTGGLMSLLLTAALARPGCTGASLAAGRPQPQHAPERGSCRRTAAPQRHSAYRAGHISTAHAPGGRAV